MYLFRIDDISINTDVEKLFSMLDLLDKKYPGCSFLLGVSCLTHDMSSEKGRRQERIFPEIFNAYSDHTNFYRVNQCGIPPYLDFLMGEYKDRLALAGHGIVHVDHRLLPKEVQRLSIVSSCSLVQSDIFIPPFNKWNVDTIDVCLEEDIRLVQFETGWKHLLYQKIEGEGNYYFHTHDFDLDQFTCLLSNT